jgi:hypothetical protein
MATITLGLTSTPVTVSKTFNGSDQDVQDMLDWAAVTYGQWIQGQFNPTNTAGFVPTNQEIATAIGYDFINHIKAAVQNFKTTPPTPAVVPPPLTWS